jgi:hypothetical protein
METGSHIEEMNNYILYRIMEYYYRVNRTPVVYPMFNLGIDTLCPLWGIFFGFSAPPPPQIPKCHLELTQQSLQQLAHFIIMWFQILKCVHIKVILLCSDVCCDTVSTENIYRKLRPAILTLSLSKIHYNPILIVPFSCSLRGPFISHSC